jgi:hypothetical protein
MRIRSKPRPDKVLTSPPAAAPTRCQRRHATSPSSLEATTTPNTSPPTIITAEPVSDFHEYALLGPREQLRYDLLDRRRLGATAAPSSVRT